ncbi:magnesium transporter MgtE N-terminal domain-containing protein [Chloroflexota bacterium]
MGTDKTAAIIEEVATDKAAGIIKKVTTKKAATIIEKLTTKKAGAIIGKVTSKQAADILGKVTSKKAGAILGNLAAKNAAAIMEELTTDMLNDTIPAMSETSLTERLPEMSVSKLLSLNVKALFAALPNTPTAHLTGEVPPVPPEVYRDAPIVLYETDSGEKAVAIKTPAGDWVTVIGTPAPVERLMIKTIRELADVTTTLYISEQQPLEALIMLPSGQIGRAYISISFENATPEDIELGHMTFYVEKDWLQENSVHKWAVALHRYDPVANK